MNRGVEGLVENWEPARMLLRILVRRIGDMGFEWVQMEAKSHEYSRQRQDQDAGVVKALIIGAFVRGPWWCE